MQFQKYKEALLFAFSKMAKKAIFGPGKSPKNCIFGSFKLFSGAKIDLMPFLKLQKMCFCTFEIALFF